MGRIISLYSIYGIIHFVVNCRYGLVKNTSISIQDTYYLGRTFEFKAIICALKSAVGSSDHILVFL